MSRCGLKGKKPYSKSEAKRVAEHLRQFDEDPKAPLGCYRCTDCGRWHVGHNRYAREVQA